jgi:hypothetical protein
MGVNHIKKGILPSGRTLLLIRVCFSGLSQMETGTAVSQRIKEKYHAP